MPQRHAVYPIGVVKRLTGLSERQIRYYEERGLVAPERTEGRQRLYTAEDVERLLQVRILRAQGMTVRDVKELLERDGGREARERVASLPDYEARLRDIHLSRRLANLPGGERTLLIRRAQLQREWGIGRQSERDDG